jgi:hypothetical protein
MAVGGVVRIERSSQGAGCLALARPIRDDEERGGVHRARAQVDDLDPAALFSARRVDTSEPRAYAPVRFQAG